MTNSPQPGQPNIDDLQAFPVLTSEVGQVGVSRSATLGAPIGQLAEQALRDVLSIRPTTSDPQSFVAALHNAFTVTEVDGRATWNWTPRSFTVQADMGEVTGAQASIYARAKSALDQSVVLLDGLAALRSDADDEDVHAMRQIVRSGLLELVDELGRVGGPRVQRVDSLFDALLGTSAPQQANLLAPASVATLVQIETDPEKVRGLLGTVRERFGLARVRVNTIDEEQNLTNYLILVDHVIALRQNWEARKGFFTGQEGDVFLGTQLVQLGWALDVLVESVHEAEAAMDSVFLGSGERQTLKLRFNDPRFPFADATEPPLTIAELLGWVERFAREEGPRIIRDAGKDGVISLIATLKRLEKLVALARQIAYQPSDNPTRGFHTPRVQRSMDELTIHVQRASELAAQVRREPGPVVLLVEPVISKKGQGIGLLFFGENFQKGAQAALELPPSVPTQSVLRLVDQQPVIISDTALRATFDLSQAQPGSWTAVVVNPDFGEGRLADAFVIESDALPLPAPIVVDIVPEIAAQGQTVDVIVIGGNFRADDSWDFGTDVSAGQPTLLSGGSIRLALAIGQLAALGPRDVTVTNSAGDTATLEDGFAVAPSAPVPTPPAVLDLLAVLPGHAAPGQRTKVDITASAFSNELHLSLFGSGVDVHSTTFVDATHLHADISIDQQALPGPRDVMVVSAGNAVGRLTGGFIVDPPFELPLSLLRVTPNRGLQFETVGTTVDGTGFETAAAVDYGEGIDTHTLFVSGQKLMVVAVIDAEAEPGPRDVTVTNPDGSSVTLLSGFVVEARATTPTPTPTPSTTPSPTPSTTPTPTPTPSPTPTASVTPTPTASASPTPSITPTPTASASPMPSITPTPEFTNAPGTSPTISTGGSTAPPSVAPVGSLPPGHVTERPGPPLDEPVVRPQGGAPLRVQTIELRSGEQVIGRPMKDGVLEAPDPLPFSASQQIDTLRVVFNKRIDPAAAAGDGMLVWNVDRGRKVTGKWEAASSRVVTFVPKAGSFAPGVHRFKLNGDAAERSASQASNGSVLGESVEFSFVITKD